MVATIGESEAAMSNVSVSAKSPLDESRPVVPSIAISVLGTFSLTVAGREVDGLPAGSQRLLVFLALHDRAVTRSAMAGTMWPDASNFNAGISLRSALSRLDGAPRDAVVPTSDSLGLADHVTVDLRAAQALAQRLLVPNASPDDADLSPAAVGTLSEELLPDWYDDWVINEAEDWRELRVNALEAQARFLTARGRLSEATGPARAAIRVAPLRESANASLIRVHLAEGNQSEALRVFNRYEKLLQFELGLEPTRLLSDLVSAIRRP
jgi:DNA-binding SARP family transcriptional activator